jgi:autotransporter-associated beta strand protein
MTGSLTILGLQIDGALGDQTYTSGTLTLTQTDAFTNGTSNNRRFTFNGGVMALGSSNRNLTLVHTESGYCINFATAGAITGSGIVSIINGLANGNYNNAYFGSSGAHTGFTGTLRFTDGSGIFSGAASTGCFTGADIIIDGPNCILSVGTSGAGIGGTGKTLTINENVMLGRSAYSTQINPNVVLAGTGTRTLTVDGNTTMSGTVTGTAGVTVTVSGSTGRVGGTGTKFLYATGSSSGLTGACSVTGGRFIVAPATTVARYQPSSLNVDASGQFEYYPMSNTDFTFPCAPTGNGFISISGNHLSGGGVTFSVGQLTSFGGIVRVQPAPDSGFQAARVRLYELPIGIDWFAVPNANAAMTGEVTYLGTAATYAASLTLDNFNNTSTPGLTGGTYKLTVPDTSGALNITGTVQRLNTAATASARMSLTLGGTNTGNNTLSGDISEVGTNSAILGLTKVDAGRWVLSGANSSHTGIHTVSAGTLSAQSAKALGNATSAGGVTISGTGVLELAGGITLNKSATAFTIHQTSPITSVGDNTVQTAGITLGGTTTFEVTTGNRLAIANSGAITDGASTFGLTKTGDGELALAAFSNTYDGAVTVTAGTLAVGSLGALGTGVATIQLTGNLKYTGSGETLSRATLLNGSAPSFEASGSGALTVSNLSTSVSTKTLTLKGSNTGANTITSSLTDNSGVLSLAKEDAGKWVVTSRTYSGTTAVNAGTLRCEATNSATTTGAVTIGASGTVELVTNTLASSGAGNGEVLGTGNVTVNGGIIKTRGGTTQKGQVRYGGNLTFGAGSSLYIGAAA